MKYVAFVCLGIAMGFIGGVQYQKVATLDQAIDITKNALNEGIDIFKKDTND